MNKILCFDVSNHSCSVAISEGQNILAFEQELRPSMQAERLFVLIESALKTAHLHYQDLDYLAVTVGPGSFTGIRIGLAAARGIIRASKIKGLGVTNFEAAYYRLATQVKEYDNAFILLNAYRNQTYLQEFTNNGIKSKPLLVDNSDIKGILTSKKGRIICTGSGASSVYDEIKNIENLTILPRFPVVKALHIARYADEKINQGIFDPIEPLYIRPPDAKATIIQQFPLKATSVIK